jgi:GNAT superfamily N-acetyltransferase
MPIDPFLLIRPYHPPDTEAIAELYYQTIHRINSRDYSPEQINAWAPFPQDLDRWRERLSQKMTFVANYRGEIVGFAEFEANGHIDCFYCRHDFQGKGAGSKLLQTIEQKATELGVERIFAEVSITAKPFFRHKGFQVDRQQEVECRGVTLTNFVMSKIL